MPELHVSCIQSAVNLLNDSFSIVVRVDVHACVFACVHLLTEESDGSDEVRQPYSLQESGSQQTVKKMFVGGMKDDTTEDQVRSVFSEFGDIEHIDMITDKATGKTRGFCFVTFEDYDPVDKCVCKYLDWNGSFLKVCGNSGLMATIMLSQH